MIFHHQNSKVIFVTSMPSNTCFFIRLFVVHGKHMKYPNCIPPLILLSQNNWLNSFSYLQLKIFLAKITRSKQLHNSQTLHQNSIQACHSNLNKTQLSDYPPTFTTKYLYPIKTYRLLCPQNYIMKQFLRSLHILVKNTTISTFKGFPVN